VCAGIIAIQGDFEKHESACRSVGSETKYVRVPEDLVDCTHLIIPGGESTTVGLLMQRFGLDTAIREAVESGVPVWGTCMGLIMLAREIENRPNQFSLNLLDVRVKRNAFGRQVHSFESEIKVAGLDEPINAVFIRAPIVTQLGAAVEVLASIDDQIVAVRQGSRVGTSFHPELTDDTRFHEWFLQL